MSKTLKITISVVLLIALAVASYLMLNNSWGQAKLPKINTLLTALPKTDTQADRGTAAGYTAPDMSGFIKAAEISAETWNSSESSFWDHNIQIKPETIILTTTAGEYTLNKVELYHYAGMNYGSESSFTFEPDKQHRFVAGESLVVQVPENFWSQNIQNVVLKFNKVYNTAEVEVWLKPHEEFSIRGACVYTDSLDANGAAVNPQCTENYSAAECSIAANYTMFRPDINECPSKELSDDKFDAAYWADARNANVWSRSMFYNAGGGDSGKSAEIAFESYICGRIPDACH